MATVGAAAPEFSQGLNRSTNLAAQDNFVAYHSKYLRLNINLPLNMSLFCQYTIAHIVTHYAISTILCTPHMPVEPSRYLDIGIQIQAALASICT